MTIRPIYFIFDKEGYVTSANHLTSAQQKAADLSGRAASIAWESTGASLWIGDGYGDDGRFRFIIRREFIDDPDVIAEHVLDRQAVIFDTSHGPMAVPVVSYRGVRGAALTNEGDEPITIYGYTYRFSYTPATADTLPPNGVMAPGETLSVELS